MAQLIKLRILPEKHHALKKQGTIFINRAIKQEDRRRQHELAQILAKFKEEKARLIKDFLMDRVHQYQIAMACAHIGSVRRTAVEIITLFYLWQQNIAVEARAMMDLARKIAQTVLNTANLQSICDSKNLLISQELQEYFSVKITLTSHEFMAVKNFISSGQHYFDRLSFLSFDQHDKSTALSIGWQQEMRTLNLDGIDIQWILKRVIKNIKKIDKEALE